ncbi:MAG: aminotransferase class V-fold PLP-dependent enzyme [Gemmatimonadetes bacterium]|nr:aminotransferase class V-fold PLP-dependent enzyme [Gemmatimonadota bacterium]
MLTCQQDLFALPAESHYLNCAYMSPLSRRVEAAGVAGIRRKLVPSDITPDDFFAGPDAVRRLFAGIVGAPAAERIAVIPSVSYGMAVVERNTAVSPGQNVVTLLDQFPSNVYPWRRLCDGGHATLRSVAPPTTGPGMAEAWNGAILDAIDDATALVAVPHVHWIDGTRFDLDGISARARQVGATFVVDGTQSVGALPFDVQTIQPDALVCAGYKWLGGPYSIGAAYFGPRFDGGLPVEDGWLARIGSEDFARLVDYRDELRPAARRYDVGEVSNFILTSMFVAALEQLLEWGVENITPYCCQLTGDLIADLEAAGFGVTDKRWRSGHLFGFRVPGGFDMPAFRERLVSHRVSIALRGDAIRVSPYVYNDESDVAALRAALQL